jgi:hypothetical protein
MVEGSQETFTIEQITVLIEALTTALQSHVETIYELSSTVLSLSIVANDLDRRVKILEILVTPGGKES